MEDTEFEALLQRKSTGDRESDATDQTDDEKPYTGSNTKNYVLITNLLIIRIMIDFIFKNPLIFWDDYSSGLGISITQFSYILVASELGCICALFLGEYNEKLFASYQNMIIAYLIICGIASIIMIFAVYFNSVVLIILWCCCCRFIVGVSFSCISASTIKVASQTTVDKKKMSRTIAILHYSWPISTVLNIFAGYAIDDASWIYVFLISGILLIATALVSKLLFVYYPSTVTSTTTETHTPSISELDSVDEEVADDIDADVDIDDEVNGLHALLKDTNSVLIVVASFFMSFRSRTIYVVTSSLWLEDTFNLNAIDVGYATVSIIIGEVIALFLVGYFTPKHDLWKSAVSALLFQFFCGGFLLFILALIYGNNVGLIVALMIACLLTLGHQCFYVVQQTNAVQYAPNQKLTFLLLLAERMSQEIAAVIALLLTGDIWDYFYSNAILIFSIIWMVGTLFEGIALFIYKTPKNDMLP